MTPLRRRVIDAMVLRGFAAVTQETYLSAVGRMARHHHLSPDLLTDEQAQTAMLYLLQDRQRSRASVNITSCDLRFLVCDVLGQAERRTPNAKRQTQIPMGRHPQRLPEVLCRAEVAAVLAAPMSLKARTSEHHQPLPAQGPSRPQRWGQRAVAAVAARAGHGISRVALNAALTAAQALSRRRERHPGRGAEHLRAGLLA